MAAGGVSYSRGQRDFLPAPPQGNLSFIFAGDTSPNGGDPMTLQRPPAFPTSPEVYDPPAARPDRRQKAAMVVQLLLGEGQRLSLSRLPEETQVSLTHALARLRLVDRATLDAAITEFAQDVENLGIAAPGSVEATLESLSGQISPGVQARLRRELAQAHGIDPWHAVTALPVADLLPVMHRESVEVAAVTLGKLPVTKAAEILGKLPGDRARRITRAMSQTAAISPDTVACIGSALASDYANPPDSAFNAPPEERLGAILNSALSDTRDAVLQSLADDDAGFAEGVRRAILTFADLPQRLNPLDVPRLLRGVPQPDVVTALAYAATASAAEAAAATFILGNLSQRMADTLREEMDERAPPRRIEGEAACNALLANLRERQAAGDITLLPHPDDHE